MYHFLPLPTNSFTFKCHLTPLSMNFNMFVPATPQWTHRDKERESKGEKERGKQGTHRKTSRERKRDGEWDRGAEASRKQRQAGHPSSCPSQSPKLANSLRVVWNHWSKSANYLRGTPNPSCGFPPHCNEITIFILGFAPHWNEITIFILRFPPHCNETTIFNFEFAPHCNDLHILIWKCANHYSGVEFQNTK